VDSNEVEDAGAFIKMRISKRCPSIPCWKKSLM
jgi:hypothetical protein